MPTEIERKFLVSGSDWRTADAQRISQGYLNRDKLQLESGVDSVFSMEQRGVAAFGPVVCSAREIPCFCRKHSIT